METPNTHTHNTHRRTTKRRKKSACPLWKRILHIMIATIVILVLCVVLAIGTAWYYGWLPTREELPQFKERLYTLFHHNPNVQLPDAEVIGIDISHYQSYIDWDEVCLYLDKQRLLYREPHDGCSKREIDFVIAKATEGVRKQDNFYTRNKAGAAKYNMLFGAYHFYSPTLSARKQADNYIRTANLQRGDMVPILDVEVYKNRLPEADSILCWLKQVEHYYGAKPIIYTNENCYQTFFMKHKDLLNYHFWIARYGGQTPNRMHLMWQFTEMGVVAGIKGYTDINILRGTKEDLIQKCTIH